MKKLSKPLQYIFDSDADFEIILVGCGGTGSFVAQDIVRLMWHLKQDGKAISALFVDNDIVEEKNVGRQNFSPADIGKGKAEALSTKFNRAYGLEIAYFQGGIEQWQPPLKTHEYRGRITVFVGCVDNAYARIGIETHIATYQKFKRAAFWLDCGNFENAGQVLLGNAFKKSENSGPEEKLGLCKNIPLPSVVHPELVSPEKATKKKLSCAELAERNAQSLMINRAISVYAGQYLYDIVVKKTITKYATYISLGGCSATSKLITKDIWNAH